METATVDEKAKGNPYMMGFIFWKGTAKKVQHVVDLGYQAIHQLEEGSRFGSSKTFAKFADAYPDFNIRSAAQGLPFVVPDQSNLPDQSMEEVNWQEKYFELEVRFSTLETMYNALSNDFRQLVSKYNNLLEKLMKKADPSFLESSSQTTAFALFNRIGYDYPGCEDMQPEGRVIVHPASVGKTGNVIAVQWGVAAGSAQTA